MDLLQISASKSTYKLLLNKGIASKIFLNRREKERERRKRINDIMGLAQDIIKKVDRKRQLAEGRRLKIKGI